MSKKYIKTKKVVIPLLTLVMLSSQLMGCAALNSKELVEEMRESKEVEIEYNELERDNIELTKIGVNEDTEDTTSNEESNTNKEESHDIVIDSTGTAEVVQTSLSAEQAAEQAAKKAEQAAQAKKAEQERLAAQQAAAKKAEQERLAAEQAAQQAAAKKAEQERLAAEKAKQQQQQAAQQQQQTQTSITPTTFDTPSNTGKVGITAEDFEAGDTTGSLDLDGFTLETDPSKQPTMYGG